MAKAGHIPFTRELRTLINVMLMASGVKLLDFGLAKLREVEPDPKRGCMYEMVSGTRPFDAPTRAGLAAAILTREPLENGDAIRAGTVVLTFHAGHAPGSTSQSARSSQWRSDLPPPREVATAEAARTNLSRGKAFATVIQPVDLNRDGGLRFRFGVGSVSCWLASSSGAGASRFSVLFGR